MAIHSKFSDSQLQAIIAKRNEGRTYHQIATWFKSQYGTEHSADSFRRAFDNYSHLFEITDVKQRVEILKESARKAKLSSRHGRANRDILNYLNNQDDLLKQVRQLVAEIQVDKIKIPRRPKPPKRMTKMVAELMISDVHVGKVTDNFNLEVCKDRINQLVAVVLNELDTAGKQFRLEKVIVALLGDIVESQTMHGVESAKGCEFGNSKQVVEAVKLLFFNLLLPLAQTGIPIDVPCVPGNHDRTEHKRTYHNPGEENLTFIIYTMLEELCKAHGLSNVTFAITQGSYVLHEVFGNFILYEHGDNTRACDKKTLEAHLNKRQSQLGVVVDFLRLGHWHEYVCFGRGRIIVNDSVPGPDSFSDTLGFNSHAGQTLNFYIPTRERPNCFYKSFPIYLK